jgi:hypothetical protein
MRWILGASLVVGISLWNAGDVRACNTCADLGSVTCGYYNDGCDNYISCGTCSNPQSTCVEGNCACTPLGCADFGATCGTYFDGCLYYISCGDCPPGYGCNNGSCTCTPSGCQPGQCGATQDSCGDPLSCGSCPSGQECLGVAPIFRTPSGASKLLESGQWQDRGNSTTTSSSVRRCA